METKKPSFFKSIALKFVSPIPIIRKKHLVMNILWLVLAVVCIIAGIVVGFVAGSNIFSGLQEEVNIPSGAISALGIWVCLSWGCIIPMLVPILKFMGSTIKSSFNIGKKFTYTEASSTKVGSVGNGFLDAPGGPTADIYQISTYKKDRRWLFGIIGLLLSYLAIGLVFGYFGFVIVAVKSVFVVREIVKYLNSPREEAEA